MVTVDMPACRPVIMPMGGGAAAIGMVTVDTPACRPVIMPMGGGAAAIGSFTAGPAGRGRRSA